MAKQDPKMLSALLSYPFEMGLVESLSDNDSVLISGAAIWAGASENADILTYHYPDYVQWQTKGYAMLEGYLAEKFYQWVLCHLPKQKEASQYQLARALDVLEDGGQLMAMAANDSGGKRLEKWFKDLGLQPTSTSKSKCRIVWATKENANVEILEQYLDAGAPHICGFENYEFMTQAGIFGWDKIDQGSVLLTEFVPADLKGKGADFGCGYGFLADCILQNCDNVQSLIVADADARALNCCRVNLEKYDRNIDFKWCDLTTSDTSFEALDFIIMNPPFHDGKMSHSDIGLKFIDKASQSLRKGGVLYMVANAHLPYEKRLEAQFTKVNKLTEAVGFKVFQAIK